MKTIAIANQKGGTGKTTTAYNLGIALTQQGYRVLMVDFDPQGNLSCYCGIPPEQDLEQTITELLMKVAYEKPLSHRECVYQSRRTDDSAPQVDFIPSNLRLASFELAMGTMMCREVLLKTCLEQYSSQYDYCIIDCSPSVGLLLTNALSAANEVIIPMQAQPFSVVGMSQLTNSISSVQRKINPGLHMSDPIAQHLGSWSQEINVLSICLRIALAVFLTSVIGCERSSKRHSAGLRTFVLISFSSTICMILDIYLMQTQAIDIPILSAATMISAASISGKSILFSSRGQIKGLTTSAALWSCAALGFTIGAGLYTVTLIVFAFLLCILSAFPTIEVYLKNRSNHFEIHLELKNIEYLRDFVTVSRRLGLRIDDIESNPAYVGSGLSVYTITVTICSSELKKYKTHHEIIEALKSLDYIYHLEELR